MNLIKDDKLVESYLLALDLNLENDFLDLLRAEMHRRHIMMNNESRCNPSLKGYAS